MLSEECDGNLLGLIYEKTKQALSDAHFELSDVSRCIRYSTEEWSEKTTMNEGIHSGAKRAMDSGIVEVGGYRSEEIEEDCRYRHSAFELES